MSPAPPIARNVLIRQPDAARQPSGLPEDVDWHAAARMEVAADTQIARLEQRRQPLADRNRAVLVESAVVAETIEIELERFRLDEPTIGYVVDDQDGKIGLAGHRAQGRELGKREAR